MRESIYNLAHRTISKIEIIDDNFVFYENVEGDDIEFLTCEIGACYAFNGNFFKEAVEAHENKLKG